MSLRARLADALHRGLLRLAALLEPWRTVPAEHVADVLPVRHPLHYHAPGSAMSVMCGGHGGPWTDDRDLFARAGLARCEGCRAWLAAHPERP